MPLGEKSVTPIEALYRRARINPNGIAFIRGREQWDYGRVAAQVERVAHGMFEHGLRKGDRVVLHMKHRPEFVVAIYACFHLGAIAVPLKNRFETVELKRLMTYLRPALYIGDATLASGLDAVDGSILPLQMRYVVGEMGGVRAKPWASLSSDGSVPPPVSTDIHSQAVLFVKPEIGNEPSCVIHTHATLSALFALPFVGGCE